MKSLIAMLIKQGSKSSFLTRNCTEEELVSTNTSSEYVPDNMKITKLGSIGNVGLLGTIG